MSRFHYMTILLLLSVNVSICHAQGINSKVVKYLETKVGERIGGGECAHAASEALRVAGAEFINSQIAADVPAEGDYVWGTLLKIVSYKDDKWTDSNSMAKLLAGDVIQYRNAKFVYPVFADETAVSVSGSRTEIAPHHTSIIAAVNSEGMPTTVFEQNQNGVRILSKNSIDLSKLKDGFVRVYRPKTRVNSVGKIKYSLLNNASTPQSASVQVDASTSIGTITLDAANQPTSYLTSLFSTNNPTARFRLVLANGESIVVANAGGYEIYTRSNEKLAIRRLTP